MSNPSSSKKPLSKNPPPGSWKPFVKIKQSVFRPLERFLAIQAASGIILLIAAAFALIWANSPWASTYTDLWQTTFAVHLGSFSFERSLEWFVNDILMVIFFFVVGMEIRREIYEGELSEWRRAALPVMAAIGGMIVPALLYTAIAGAPEIRGGWGIPMATDIAFAVGILTLLGSRVPAALRVLLLALAVIDDLGAIIVIAIFYSSGIDWTGFALAILGILAVIALQRFGVRSKAIYIIPGIITWAGIYMMGVHPTIAGVLIGLLTPVQAWVGVEDSSPAENLISSLHPWVAFAIMPIFAVANAGVSITNGVVFDTETWKIIIGIGVGLVVGKPIGVLIATWLTLRLKIGILPRGITQRHLLVLGIVAGIGFTMSLFISALAFSDPKFLGAAKLGVLIASGIAVVLSLIIGKLLLPSVQVEGIAKTADEAEQSTDL